MAKGKDRPAKEPKKPKKEKPKAPVTVGLASRPPPRAKDKS